MKMKEEPREEFDVIVVGAGNAAFCAALRAREGGARVLVLERAPEEEAGGNSRFTAGAMRVVYRGVEDILELVPDLSEDEKATTDFGSYTEDMFFDDMAKITQYRSDPDLLELLVKQSFPTLKWMRSKSIRFVPIYGRQAFKVDGRFRFWGGLTVEVSGGGPGLVDSLTEAALREDIEIRYSTPVSSLIFEEGRVQGVVYRTPYGDRNLYAKSVILACGGFQANAEWRARYLGEGWDLAKVRGTRYNTGDGIRME